MKNVILFGYWIIRLFVSWTWQSIFNFFSSIFVFFSLCLTIRLRCGLLISLGFSHHYWFGIFIENFIIIIIMVIQWNNNNDGCDFDRLYVYICFFDFSDFISVSTKKNDEQKRLNLFAFFFFFWYLGYSMIMWDVISFAEKKETILTQFGMWLNRIKWRKWK